MNSELRKAMHNRNMWRGKHFRNKKDKYSRSMYVKWRNKVIKLHEKFLSKITLIDGAIQNITQGIFTKWCVRFCQINLHPAMIKSSSVMMEILSLIPHRSLISLMCIIRLSRHITASPMGLILLPLRMLYEDIHRMRA